MHTAQKCAQNFAKVDGVFDTLRLTEDNKITIFQLLASILHLGNVVFEDENENKARIMKSSEKHIDFAAKLLSLSSEELKNALLSKPMHIEPNFL